MILGSVREEGVVSDSRYYSLPTVVPLLAVLAAPVAFYPDVAAGAGAPVAFYPMGSAVRRLSVVAADPDVAGSVPAVEAGLPDPAGMRGGGNDFYGTRWRWAEADNNLGSCGERGGEDESSGDG
jgi:hypothetical protein